MRKTTDPLIAEGIHRFNTQKFFEAHEALEAVWLKASGDEKLLLHGLIQVAAAFHHYAHENRAGFRSLLDKGLKKLEVLKEAEHTIDLAALRHELRLWCEYFDAKHYTPAPLLPRIRRVRT